MGDRGQIKLVGTDGLDGGDIYLYTHWGASGMEYDLAIALDRGRGRWNDPCYLNRIIFSEMIQKEVLEETGYGICTQPHGDVWRMIEVNHEKQTVTISVKQYDDNYIAYQWLTEEYTYETFIGEYATIAK